MAGEIREMQGVETNQESFEKLPLGELKKKRQDLENNLAKIENPEEKEKIQKSIQFVDYLIERKIRAEKNLKEKSIDDLTLEEAKDALSNLQNEYANLEDSYKGEKTIKSFINNTIGNLFGINISTKAEANTFQEKLIDKIYGKGTFENGYSPDGKFITGFNNEKGNFVVSIDEFEKVLKTEKDTTKINSKALANYFSYLDSKGLLTQETFEEKLTYASSKVLSELWNKEDNGVGYKVLEKKGLINKVKSIIEKFNKAVQDSIDITEPVNKILVIIKGGLKNLNNTEKIREIEGMKKYLNLINNKEEVLKILEIYKSEGKTIELSYLSPELQNDKNFVFNNNTRLSNGNIEKFLRNTDDEFFSNNIDKIFEKINKEINLSTGISNEHYIMQPAYQLVYKAINSGVPNKKIKELIKKHNINIKGTFLENFIIKKHGNESVNENYIDKFKNTPPTKEELDYIIQSIILGKNKEKYLDTLLTIIENSNKYPTGSIDLTELQNLPIKDEKYLSFTIEKNPVFFLATGGKLDSNKKMDAFLNSPLMTIDVLLYSFDYFNDINRFLQVFEFIKGKKGGKINEDEIIGGLIKHPSYAMKLLNFIKKADQENGIEKIYVEDFIELKGILYKNNLVHEIYNNFASLLEATNKVKQVRESNGIEGGQKDGFYNAIIKNEILENDIAEKIGKNILNPEKLRTALGIEELIKKLVEEKKSPAEISKILKQITEQVTNYLEELNKQLEESTDATGFDDELTQIDKNDGKRRLNSPAIQDKFIKKVNKYLEENKKEAPISDKEKEQLIAEFLEENTRGLDINPEPLKDKQRKNFRSIIENNWSIIQVNFYHDNTKVITEGVLAGKSIPEIQRELAEKGVNIYETSTERKERLEKEAKLQTEQKDTQAETQTSQAFSLTSEGNINIKGEKEPIKLNEDEKKLIKLSEKNIENIGNFYKTLKTVGLSQLWPHRQEIFKGIQNKRPNEFKSNDFDYLNENETKIFLNSILKSTGRNEVGLNQNLEQFKEKVRNQNSENLLGKVEQVTVFYGGRTSIEQDFLHKFFPVGSPIFKFNEFMNSI